MIGSSDEWPTSGEIEISKMAGSRPLSITSGLIYDHEGPQRFEEQIAVENEDQALTKFFHVYTIIWEEDRIRPDNLAAGLRTFIRHQQAGISGKLPVQRILLFPDKPGRRWPFCRRSR
jgi:hypothetical protein